MMRKVILLLASMAVAVLLATGVALATSLDEKEPNDSRDQAQIIYADKFSLDEDPNITDSTSVPHATINATPASNASGTNDYYSFDVPQAAVSNIGIFDMDQDPTQFQNTLWLYDSKGVEIANSSDSSSFGTGGPDPGSQNRNDGYLKHEFTEAGTYYIKVSSFTNGRVPDPSIPPTTSYKLHVSIPNHPVQAATPLTNGGFERGDLSGWTTTGVPNGAATVETSFTCQGGDCHDTTVSPVEGTKFALLRAGDADVYTTVSQTFAAGAGDTISGQARFLSIEASCDCAFNDQAEVVVKDSSNNEVIAFSAQSSTFSTPWTQWQHKFSTAGTYTVEARVKNVPDGDLRSSSYLALDAVSLEADTQAPTVSGVTPTKTTGVSRTTPNITATFSEPVDKATVEALDPTTLKSVNVKLTNTATGKQVAATVSCDADPCQKVTITPNKALAANTKYKATVTTGVEDLVGNALDQNPTTTGNQPKTWTFTTRR